MIPRSKQGLLLLFSYPLFELLMLLTPYTLRFMYDAVLFGVWVISVITYAVFYVIFVGNIRNWYRKILFGMVTFVLCVIGMYIGLFYLENKAEVRIIKEWGEEYVTIHQYRSLHKWTEQKYKVISPLLRSTDPVE